MLVPVVLSGGSGTRLWPLSRRLHPKQLMALHGEATMLQQTVARADALPDRAAPIVVCNEAHAELVQTQLEAMGRRAEAIVLEPMGRNTAPAVALAAIVAQQRHPQDDPLLLVLPADHVVRDRSAFAAAVTQGLPHARRGALVTFGVVPEGPHTGYGYIRAAPGEGPSPVQAFVEKPDLATARAYLAQGGYTWNSGMFLLRAGAYLDELRRLRPAMVDACERALVGARSEGAQLHLDAEAFAACPSDSIDYAVMEKTTNAMVVPLSAGWSDLGSWAALHELGPRDEHDDVLRGEVIAIDCEGSLVRAEHRLVVAVGLRDAVVVETADAVLVTTRDRSQDVGQVVQRLEQQGRPQAAAHLEQAHRWGRRRLIDDAEQARVEALHLHPDRATAWERDPAHALRLVVTAGEGRLERDGVPDAPLEAGAAVSIEAGARHRLVAGASGLALLLVRLPATRTGS